MSHPQSRFYHVVTDEDEEAEFWEVLKDYAERLFLVPSPPQGMLAVVGPLLPPPSSGHAGGGRYPPPPPPPSGHAGSGRPAHTLLIAS